MTCEEIRRTLSAYADGQASPEEAAAVSAHLPGCAVCDRQLRWIRAMKAGVSREKTEMPADLRAALLAEARRRGVPEVESALKARGAHPPPEPARRPAETLSLWEAWRLSWRLTAAGVASAAALATAAIVFNGVRAGTEEVPLDGLLEAHRSYALTMPSADAELVYADLGEDE